MMYRKLPYIKL